MRPAIVLVSICAALAAPVSARSGEPHALLTGTRGTVRAPLFSKTHESLAVATVDGQPVTLRELADALGAVHRARAAGGNAGEANFVPALDRLIGTRLVLLEAREMGIDELPEVKEALEQFSEVDLRRLVQRAITRGAKPSRSDVDRRYRDAVRQWRARSAMFPKEEDAKAVAEAMKAGEPFAQVVAKAVAEKKARGGTEVHTLSARLQVLPQVIRALEPLRAGATTGAIAVDKGWTVLEVVGVEYPEDASARAEAEKQALAARKAELLRRYYERLLRRHVKTDEALVASVDYEAPAPGFEALKKDQRVLATIDDQPPVTIGEVCAALEVAFFHGIEEAIQQRKLNARGKVVLEALVSRRLVHLEARRLGLDSGEEHRRAVDDRRKELVFGAFVQRAIVPDVTVSDAEGLEYYEAHRKEFVFPGFYTLASLGFETLGGARAAADKLKSGADFKWLQANAAGQLPEARQAVRFDGNTVSARAMPPDLLKALEGARPGDLRLYSSSEGGHYVVAVNQVTEPAAPSYAEVRGEIVPKIQARKVNDALTLWIAKLRKARDVRVYITQLAL